MRRSLLIVLAYFFFILPNIANANGSTSARTISHLTTGTYNNQAVMFAVLTTDHENPDSCTYADRLLINNSAQTYDSNVSILLTSLTTGKKVGAYVTGCYELFPGSGTYPLVFNLSIYLQ